MFKFSYNKKLINGIRRYSANTLADPSNLAVANANAFSINYANASPIFKNFLINLPEANLNALGLDQGNLNIKFSSNVSSNYFIGNLGVLTNVITGNYTYTTLFCYSINRDMINTSINIKDYTN
jgi:hypothetical protein